LKTPIVIVALFCLAIISCNQPSKKEDEKQGKDAVAPRDGVVEAHFPDGKLRASIPMKNGKKHGTAIEYFQSGSKYQEIDYQEGIKDGWARTYFENGQLSQETPYENGKIHGLQKKFRVNGKPAAEAMYYQDRPCKGLKEFLVDGSLKKKYPKIVFTPIDRVLAESEYTLRISLSDKVKEVEYFKGKLGTHGEIASDTEKIWSTDRQGVADLKYMVLPGTFVMEKVTIIAKIKTVQGNYYITEGQFNVAAENR
jgi:hypothetical protein